MNPWILAHTAATWAMVGVIWTIQLLVYPAMARVPANGFVEYEAFHQRRVVAVLAVFAVVEVVTAGLFAFGVGDVSRPLWLVGGALLVVLWVSTGAYFAPLHGRLADGFDADLHARLIATNWIRTVLWSARGVLALLIVREAAAR